MSRAHHFTCVSLCKLPPGCPASPAAIRSITPGLRPSVPPSHTNCASPLTTTHNLAPDLAIPRERRVIARWCRWRWRRTPVRPLGRLLLFRAGSRQHPAHQGLSNRFRTDFGQISDRFHVHRITFLEILGLPGTSRLWHRPVGTSSERPLSAYGNFFRSKLLKKSL